MLKKDLIKSLAKYKNVSLTDATTIVNNFFETMVNALVDGEQRIEIRGFGSFKIKKYKSFNGRNPKTGEPVIVNAKKLAVWHPSINLKKEIV